MGRRLEGKVAIVTGAGSGIGFTMATLFSQEGAKIVAGEWNEKTLAHVIDAVQTADGEITGMKADVANRAEAESLVEKAMSTYDKIDVLCNNAGVMDLMAGVAEVTDETWQRVMSININGPMYLSRLVIPIMLKHGGGSIINTASVAGIRGGAAGVAYTVSKHALIGLTRNTAWMYGPKGIRCNAMACGGVETNIMTSVDMTKINPEGAKRTGMYTSIMPALLKPIEIANLALFLASDESRYINGAVIPVDAGWSTA